MSGYRDGLYVKQFQTTSNISSLMGHKTSFTNGDTKSYEGVTNGVYRSGHGIFQLRKHSTIDSGTMARARSSTGFGARMSAAAAAQQASAAGMSRVGVLSAHREQNGHGPVPNHVATTNGNGAMMVATSNGHNYCNSNGHHVVAGGEASQLPPLPPSAAAAANGSVNGSVDSAEENGGVAIAAAALGQTHLSGAAGCQHHNGGGRIVNGHPSDSSGTELSAGINGIATSHTASSEQQQHGNLIIANGASSGARNQVESAAAAAAAAAYWSATAPNGSVPLRKRSVYEQHHPAAEMLNGSAASGSGITISTTIDDQMKHVDRIAKECDASRKSLEIISRRLDDLHDEVRRYRDFLGHEKSRRDPTLYKTSNAEQPSMYNDNICGTMATLTAQLTQEWSEKIKALQNQTLSNLTSKTQH
ncbi:hypothetical protein AAVH_12066 [Aphelenchoides avenae]|nr:hypothetical protein AAVH_12066 [Aphelenchus avenae]